jgi:hypothetical protein
VKEDILQLSRAEDPRSENISSNKALAGIHMVISNLLKDIGYGFG